MLYRPKHLLEYAALRTLAALVSVLPYRAALCVGWLNAWMAFHVFRYRAQEARARIRRVFGDRLTERQTRRIAWVSWRNVAFTTIEVLRFPKATLEWVKSVCDCQEAVDAWVRHARSGRGAVIACPHMGSWELASVATCLHGLPLFNIAASQKNPLVNGYLTRLRSTPGTETIPRGSGTMKQVLRKIESGGMLAILPDVRVREGGVATPFLGGTANIGKGMALFAKHADVPVFPCIVTRQGWTRHRIRLHPPIEPQKTLDKEEDVRRITITVMRIIEEAIYREPEQWFWFNKRWILDPLEDKGEKL